MRFSRATASFRVHVLTTSSLQDFLLSTGLSAHLDLLDFSLCDYCPYFSPRFLSESFPTLLSATPISAWLLFFFLSCKWFAWWFLPSCFYQASSSNIPAFVLFLSKVLFTLSICSGSTCFGAVGFLIIARLVYFSFQELGFYLTKMYVSLFFLH